MLTRTASHAKQNFGDLIGQLSRGPIAIERHHKTVAIVMAPGAALAVPDPRQEARVEQQQRELRRLVRHQQLAIELLCAPIKAQQQILDAAQEVTRRWKDEQLCSADYIQRWQHWLALPVAKLAQLMRSDAEGWGTAMRQNSAFSAK